MSDTNIDQGWIPGERAVINRRDVVTIERVTPSGRAVIDTSYFHPDGYQVTSSSRSRSFLQKWTAEIQAEIDLNARAHEVKDELIKEIEKAADFLRNRFHRWNGRITAEVSDVEMAERILAAIQAAMEAKT